MKVSIEPTEEIWEAPVNGVRVPLRVYRGKTEGGVPCDVYVLSIVPDEGHRAAFMVERPEYMRPSRNALQVDLDPQSKAPPWLEGLEEIVLAAAAAVRIENPNDEQLEAVGRFCTEVSPHTVVTLLGLLADCRYRALDQAAELAMLKTGHHGRH
jgi:hypothetical protein